MNNNYFQELPHKNRATAADAIAYNFVNFPWFLKALLWFEALCKCFGYKLVKVKKALLKAFDATGQLDEAWGSVEELNKLRAVVAAYGEGIDNNPNLSAVGR